MEEKDFYKAIILFIKLNKDVIAENSIIQEFEFLELDDVYDEDEFMTFFQEINDILYNEKFDDINDIRFMLWYLQLSIKYFKCIPFMLLKFLKGLSNITNQKITYPNVKSIYLQENIIIKIIYILKRVIQNEYFISQKNCIEYINKELSILTQMICDEINISFEFSQFDVLSDNIIAITHVYNQLDIIIDLCINVLDFSGIINYVYLNDKIKEFDS